MPTEKPHETNAQQHINEPYDESIQLSTPYNANQQPLVSSMAKHKLPAIKIQIQGSQSNLNGHTNYRRHISFDDSCKKEDGDEVRNITTKPAAKSVLRGDDYFWTFSVNSSRLSFLSHYLSMHLFYSNNLCRITFFESFYIFQYVFTDIFISWMSHFPLNSDMFHNILTTVFSGRTKYI